MGSGGFVGPALVRATAPPALAIAAWISWMELSPGIGFPDADAAAMMGRVVGVGSDSSVGWLLLTAALAGSAGAYLGAAARRVIAPGAVTGAAFGALLWLIAGMALMPLMGQIDPGTVPSGESMASGMQSGGAAEPNLVAPTFLMLHLGPLAPTGALIAWLLFGSILGAASRRGRGRVGVGR